MKRIVFTVMIAILSIGVSAQSSKMVNWTFAAKKVADKTYEIHMTAAIGGGWHLYAQAAGSGPISTKFTFVKNSLVAYNGFPKEAGKMIKIYEKAWKTDVRYYERTVDFVQLVKIKRNSATSVTGKVEFMVSNDHEVLPPSDVDFLVKVGG